MSLSLCTAQHLALVMFTNSVQSSLDKACLQAAKTQSGHGENKASWTIVNTTTVGHKEALSIMRSPSLSKDQSKDRSIRFLNHLNNNTLNSLSHLNLLTTLSNIVNSITSQSLWFRLLLRQQPQRNQCRNAEKLLHQLQATVKLLQSQSQLRSLISSFNTG
ncbi:hypothetical protein CLUG_02556 [Clavispora lusitaniae ATCC 42720]|uniref:Uncharacterized protein n=1 Tax=Clavispora lusitaniae (strain ATCC 42720) TaxID=306902 RepID=C4Y4I4_CLAL4|nr:uncharacterized protein CLUG_02556 [Clavispora lusitaniae ATCC 42720]EEQ38430.1 hypothetical protein CLUG_02556 [Clavispora lusitaniae ATCC 42720]